MSDTSHGNGNGRTRALNANSFVSVGLAMIIVGATWTLSGRLSTIEQKQTYIDMSFRELSDANKDLAKAVTRLTAVAEERARQESLMQKRGSTTPKRTGE